MWKRIFFNEDNSVDRHWRESIDNIFLLPYIAFILTNYDCINHVHIAMFFFSHIYTIEFSKHLKEEIMRLWLYYEFSSDAFTRSSVILSLSPVLSRNQIFYIISAFSDSDWNLNFSWTCKYNYVIEDINY